MAVLFIHVPEIHTREVFFFFLVLPQSRRAAEGRGNEEHTHTQAHTHSLVL